MATEAMTTKAAPRSFTVSYGVLAFFLLAANLRPALTSVGPVLEAIRSSLGLSGAATGLLSTLPLLIFASFSPLARLGDVFGIERTLAGCLALEVAGIALRSQGSIAALFGGTAIFAAGIGVANVLVPSVIKRDFPHRVGSMTTAYVMAMTLTGAVATGLAVPLSTHLAGGWRSSLAIWAVFAALALLCWLPETRKANAPIAAQRPDDGAAATPIWRSAMAWQVTVFMGLQFLIYYVTIGWMPLFLADHGASAAEAGWLLTLYQVVSFGVGVVAPRSCDADPTNAPWPWWPRWSQRCPFSGSWSRHISPAFGWSSAAPPSASPSFWRSRSSGCARAIIDGPRPFQPCRKRPPT
jgi:MFS transporter, CP family, cyanate transporter